MAGSAQGIFTMKGVILAGGNGTRLRPLTIITNKHLLPVYNKPMIYYPLQTMAECGLTDVLIVTGREHAGDFATLLGSGKEFGLKLSYEVQEEAGGIAQALSLAEDFADGGSVAVHLGDNIFENHAQLVAAVKRFETSGKDAMIFVKEVSDPQRFGVATVVNKPEPTVIKIEEKPKKPETKLAVTGFYIYKNNVFNSIKSLKPSARGELEITDVNNFYVNALRMGCESITGEWTDAGTFDSLLRAGEIAHRSRKSA